MDRLTDKCFVGEGFYQPISATSGRRSRERISKNGGDTMSISDYEAHAAHVSDEEIAFLAEIFTELIRKEEQHERSNDETL